MKNGKELWIFYKNDNVYFIIIISNNINKTMKLFTLNDYSRKIYA